MKIVTYNLNGIRARLPRLIEYLQEEKPDALCLQEIKCADEAFPIEDVRAAGYDGVWHGQKGFNGVAVLTRGRSPDLRRISLWASRLWLKAFLMSLGSPSFRYGLAVRNRRR